MPTIEARGPWSIERHEDGHKLLLLTIPITDADLDNLRALIGEPEVPADYLAMIERRLAEDAREIRAAAVREERLVERLEKVEAALRAMRAYQHADIQSIDSAQYAIDAALDAIGDGK